MSKKNKETPANAPLKEVRPTDVNSETGLAQTDINPNAQPSVALPLDTVDPSTKPHHISLDVIDEAIKQGEAKLNELTNQFNQGQAKHTEAVKQVNDLKQFCDTVNLNRVVVNSQIESFREVRKKIVELDPA